MCSIPGGRRYNLERAWTIMGNGAPCGKPSRMVALIPSISSLVDTVWGCNQAYIIAIVLLSALFFTFFQECSPIGFVVGFRQIQCGYFFYLFLPMRPSPARLWLGRGRVGIQIASHGCPLTLRYFLLMLFISSP